MCRWSTHSQPPTDNIRERWHKNEGIAWQKGKGRTTHVSAFQWRNTSSTAWRLAECISNTPHGRLLIEKLLSGEIPRDPVDYSEVYNNYSICHVVDRRFLQNSSAAVYLKLTTWTQTQCPQNQTKCPPSQTQFSLQLIHPTKIVGLTKNLLPCQ